MEKDQWWRAVRMGLAIIAGSLFAWWALDDCTGYTDGELFACFGVEWYEGLDVDRGVDGRILVESDSISQVYPPIRAESGK